MVWSCLQGCMGQVLVEGGEEPASAAALIGDFAFFAGRPDRALAQKAEASILVPGDQGWACLLEDPVRHGEGSKLLLPGQAGGLCRSADGI